ncbi:hypothetical protein FWK35_00013171 [Aphis craccivora]|uniref:Uncharacterized protein n=1 Tax=Aphis craccivora TaxID=307492 RepID=A0A6G0Z2C3_APHCR|nr:hypothetical protein FWK35_00013171 [Aphis craccivora]
MTHMYVFKYRHLLQIVKKISNIYIYICNNTTEELPSDSVDQFAQ